VHLKMLTGMIVCVVCVCGAVWRCVHVRALTPTSSAHAGALLKYYRETKNF
jgi:hypothetical protein